MDDEVIESGHVLSGGGGGKAGSIFVEGDIPAVVQATFDAPIVANEG